MGVTIKGIGSLQAKLAKLDPLTRAGMVAGVYKAGLKVEGDAKMMAPVDTGALRNSITTSGRTTADGAQASVGTSLEYAPYVELGTSRASAQPYLQPSLQKNKRTAQQIVVSEIRKAFKGI